VVVAGLDAVDWTAPWYAPLASVGRTVAASDWRDELNRRARRAAIVTGRGRPLRFDEPPAAGSTPYELHVAATGGVPTRANLHDLFNALIWLTWPRAKARLNELQAAAIERDGIGTRRGALRDAATLLDENGVLLATDDAHLLRALRAHRWHEVFCERRNAWAGVKVVIFGHALLEKLACPYKAISAHALALPMARTADDLDLSCATALAESLTPRQFAPLPVLGMPGWHSGNDDPAFYADTAVFRPAR
jgi:hypothetical protein